jgi:hypothetical protein
MFAPSAEGSHRGSLDPLERERARGEGTRARGDVKRITAEPLSV